ncbi:MAG: hypothetical protein LC808_43165 [Actinobacteria bacterium]|nr:hypothetical protein [Actinomycetota bacterium]
MPGELGFDTGPYVALAIFCEQAIEDKNGVLTLVRIVDQITVSVSGADASDDLPPGAAIQTTLVVGLKAGEARGKQTVQIVVEHPDTSRHPGPEMPVHFTQGPATGANLVLTSTIVLSTAGLYWADVLVNERLVTRAPLEVRYQVIQPGMQTS